MKGLFKSKKILFTFLFLLFIPVNVSAQRGCCSHHGGVVGCNENGRQVCADGTLSPSCTCTPTVTYVAGCTDKNAKNYNSNATKNDGSCEYYVYGCTDVTAKNYNEDAEKDDNSCEYYVYGCTDKTAKNYNKDAEKDDDSCKYYIYGCMDETAKNYNKGAEKDDGSCEYEEVNNEDSNGFISLIAIGGTATGIYYYNKKNKSNEK